MKVLYLITRAERGGAQVHLLDLIRGFRSRCEVEVATGEDGFLVEEARQLGVACYILPSLVHAVDPRKDLRALKDVISLLRRTRPNVIHAHTSKAGILGRLSARFCGIPSVFTAHTWCFAEGTSWKWKLLGVPCERLAGWAGGPIINVSNANRTLALQYRIAPAERLVTIHNGVSDAVPDAPRRSDPPVILMVARFAPQKNQAQLLETCSEIQAPFRLQFAGTGPGQAEVERRAEELQMRHKVEFLGDCGDVAGLLGKASIFALATKWEGFPLSILEAMRAGLPVVASDVGGVREAVTDGANGFLIGRDDWHEFRRALESLLTDAELRGRMAHNSRQLFEENFTADQMLRKTFNLYREVISAPVEEYENAGDRDGARPLSQHQFSNR